MEQKLESFKEKLKYGQDGEKEVAEVLINKNICVVPLYQFVSDSTPILISKNQNNILPDLLCYSNNKKIITGESFFAEVKTKNKWIKYNNSIETGLSYRLFREYYLIQTKTGNKVYLFFNHKKNNPIGLFYTELDNYSRFWDGLNCNGKQIMEQMVFYSYSNLKIIKN